MAKEIAGHIFVDGPNGRRCVKPKFGNEEVPCGRAWVDIAGASEDDIDQLNTYIAHMGPLNRREFDEIRSEVEAQYARGLGSVSCG